MGNLSSSFPQLPRFCLLCQNLMLTTLCKLSTPKEPGRRYRCPGTHNLGSNRPKSHYIWTASAFCPSTRRSAWFFAYSGPLRRFLLFFTKVFFHQRWIEADQIGPSTYVTVSVSPPFGASASLFSSPKERRQQTAQRGAQAQSKDLAPHGQPLAEGQGHEQYHR